MKIFSTVILFVLFSGCANFFIRQECQKLNWYQLGYDAALRGDRISNDPQINRCRKAEAEISESQLDVGFKAGMSRYCQPETAYQTGKQGDTLNSDFCDSNIIGLLTQKHKLGNLAYCADGLNAGLSGKKYKNVCTAESEKTFMPAYKQGRKKYLTSLLTVAENSKRENNIEASRFSSEKNILDRRISYMPIVKTGESDPYFSERNSLTSQSSTLGNRLSDLRYKNDLLQKSITEYQTELASLD
jgi:hypothetical protein